MRHWPIVPALLIVPLLARAEPPAPGAVAATVNGEALPLAAVEAEVKRVQLAAGPLSERQVARLRREIVHDLVDDALIRQYLRTETKPPSAEEAEKHWQGLLAALENRGTTLEAYLKQSGCGEPEMRARLAAQLRFDLFLDRLATDERLRKYFADHPEQFDGRTARVGLIALRVPTEAPPGERAATLARLGAIRAEIVAGRRTFSDAASLYSVDASAARGGDAGTVGVRDALLDPAITQAAHALEVGAVSSAIEVPWAAVLVTVTAKEPGKPPEFAAVAELVRERFAEEVRANLVAKLRAGATIAVTVGE